MKFFINKTAAISEKTFTAVKYSNCNNSWYLLITLKISSSKPSMWLSDPIPRRPLKEASPLIIVFKF